MRRESSTAESSTTGSTGIRVVIGLVTAVAALVLASVAAATPPTPERGLS
jgi:hypothetical protein